MAKPRFPYRFAAALRNRRCAHLLALGSLAVSAVAALAALAGCVTSQAPSDVELAGQWQLDPAVSDSVEARVSQAITQAEARQRRRRGIYGNPEERRGGRGGGGGAASGGAGAEDTGQSEPDQVVAAPVFGPDFGQLRTHLLQVLGAPPSLSLAVQPDGVTIKSDDLPGRDYQPGEPFVRFDEYGNATVSSGWSGHAFVVRERYMSRASLTERYEIDPKSGRLIYTRELKDPALGSIELKSIYHHA